MQPLRVILFNLFLSAVVLAAAYCVFLLDPFLPVLLPAVLSPFSWPAYIVGSSLIVWAVVTLGRYSGASGAPGDPTKRLVTQGPYAWMRNPIYTGDGLILLGLAFQNRSPSMLAAAVLYGFAIDQFVRRVEEQAAERRFGDVYRQYRQGVPRWLPGIHRPKR
jgi:protein-S-isoprenylcysteine O-methyltransferase Ste14